MISVTDLSGRRRRPSKTCDTKTKALAEKRKMLSEYGGSRVGTAEKQTVAQWLERWFKKNIKDKKALSTQKCYKLAIDRHISPYLGRKQLKKLSAEDIEDWIDAVKKDGVGDRGCQLAFIVLRSALKRAKRLKKIIDNPCLDVDQPKYEAPEAEVFSKEQASRMFHEAEGVRLGPLFQLAFATGARQGELLGLEWDSVDFEAGVIHIKQQLIEGTGFFEISSTLKTKTSRRSIEIPGSVLAALNDHRAAMLKEKHLGKYVFVGTHGGLLRKSNLDKIWRRFQRSCDIESPLGFHSTRHTYCTLQLCANVAPKMVARVTGHKNVAVLLNTYSHILGGMPEGARDEIERSLNHKVGG